MIRDWTFSRADTLVPEPGNSQAFNRYSYVNNNPVKYVDPTGHFSEQEIKQFFGLEANAAWEEVLKFFQEGGILAGRWGWLEVLRQAEVGDRIDIQWNSTIPLPEGHPLMGDGFAGWFIKDNEGRLLIGNKDLGDYFDQMKAAKYGGHYDLTHYLREGIYGAVTCWEGLACDTSSFSTAAIHDPYLRTQVKWERFIAEPMKTFELIEMGGVTAFTSALTVGEMMAVASACVTPVSCAVGAMVMAPNVALTGIATRGLAEGTYRYFMREFTETTP